MTTADPQSCRRALREIGEIAAVALIDGGRMSPEETLRTIGAIAGWVEETALQSGPDCGAIIHRIHDLTRPDRLDRLDDAGTLITFDEVITLLRAPSVPGAASSPASHQAQGPADRTGVDAPTAP